MNCHAYQMEQLYTISHAGDQMIFVPLHMQPQHSFASPVSQETFSNVSLTSHIWELSRDSQGSRRVQEAIDLASNDDERAAIAQELHGKVWEALECRNANHVLQKLISTMRPQASQFVIDEIMSLGSAAYAAQHCFGCRVVERLLEHCTPEQVRPLVEDLLDAGPKLCTDQYGNFVVQHVLEFGTDEHKHRMSRIVAAQITSIPGDYHGCSVVSAALTHSLEKDKIVVARSVLARRGFLVCMARQRHGHDAVMCLLNLVNTKERMEAERQLRASLGQLQRSRYGRVMAKYLESQSLGRSGE